MTSQHLPALKQQFKVLIVIHVWLSVAHLCSFMHTEVPPQICVTNKSPNVDIHCEVQTENGTYQVLIAVATQVTTQVLIAVAQ